MKRNQSVFVCFLLFILGFPLLSVARDIIGYFPSWKWQDRNHLVNPSTIPFHKLTIINYAFFIPQEDGTLVGMVPEADEHLLKDTIDSLSGQVLPNSSLISRAHQQGVKVMLSIGGWTDSDNFPQIAADPQKRANFAHDCIRHIKTYGFNGIDVDWEYPGYIPHNGTVQDKQNYNLLLQTIRDSLTALQKETNQTYLLSAALPASTTHSVNIEMPRVSEILDFLNIMTYDFFGPWEEISNHNAPLYAPAHGDSTHNFDFAFNLYTNVYKVPAGKINLGVPFYGHSYANCTALHSTYQGNERNIFTDLGGATYVNIMNHFNLFSRHWDARAQVPYLVSDSLKLFVSYDDPRSIGLKADYVIKNQARGLIIWEITDDFFEDGQTPLLDTIYDKFQSR